MNEDRMSKEFWMAFEIKSDRGREYDQRYEQLLSVMEDRLPDIDVSAPVLPPFGTHRMFCFARRIVRHGIKSDAVYAYAVLPVQTNNWLQAKQLFYENYPEYDHLLFIFWDNGDLAKSLAPETGDYQTLINTARNLMQKNDWLPYNSPWFMGDGED